MRRARVVVSQSLTQTLFRSAQDTVTTSSRSFVKLDCGMTEVLRPSLCVPRLPAMLSALR